MGDHRPALACRIVLADPPLAEPGIPPSGRRAVRTLLEAFLIPGEHDRAVDDDTLPDMLTPFREWYRKAPGDKRAAWKGIREREVAQARARRERVEFRPAWADDRKLLPMKPPGRL